MAERTDVRLWRAAIHAYEGGLRRRPVFRYWRELEASQWWPRERLEELQFERLRALLRHTATTSPYYRDCWAALGLDANAVQAPADFRRWPVIDRETIRAHRLAMRSSSASGLIAKATGGSSGVPLHFDLDTNSSQRRTAAWHRGYGWAGAAPGTRQWYLWGVAPRSAGVWQHRKMRLYDALYRRTTESCFDLAESQVDRFHASLARTRPDVIVAYASALFSFARMLEARGRSPFSPGVVVVGAEKLHPFQREVIERVFSAPVFETYGSREFMLMGAECSVHTGLHLTMENLVVEVLDDAGRSVPHGVEGNVVVTDLTNLGMPFIRYANGDRAVLAPAPCSCGRGLPMLSSVTGRRLDMLQTPEGGTLPGEFFPHLLKEIPAVLRFQVVQERLDRIHLRVVAPGWTAVNEAWLRSELAAVAPSLQLEIEQVAEIPLTAAGKLQVVVSRLAGAPRVTS